MARSKFEEILMPPGVSFPANETELLADLGLVFTYGLSTGVLRPRYGKRLLRSLALRHYWFYKLLAKAARRRSISPTEVGERELGEFEEMARRVEETLPLD